jgi:phenylacetate-coenzyme A ligase PaaK-like adenylate-forming protein
MAEASTTSAKRLTTPGGNLHEIVIWARDRSPFYRERLKDVDLNVESDAQILAQIPILEREVIQPATNTLPNVLSCVPPEECVRFHHTSGSGGGQSLWVFDTSEDWQTIVNCWSVGLLDFYDIQPTDRLLICSSYGRFIGFWGLHDAAVKCGVLTVSGADLDTVGRADLIGRLGITVVAATSTYALVLGDTVRHRCPSHNVRLVVTSGEPRPRATRERIRSIWGCKTTDTAGMTETGTLQMIECPLFPGDMHVLDGPFIEEVLHPETRTPVADGELGVRVVTTLQRRGMPFIRYWTNDLVVRKPAQCSCNLTQYVYNGGIRGRLDQMVKVHGVWFVPSMIEDVVRQFPEIREFCSVFMTDDRGVDQLLVEIEVDLGSESSHSSNLVSEFLLECKRQIGFRPRVGLKPPGSLPRFEMKARRWRDERKFKETL